MGGRSAPCSRDGVLPKRNISGKDLATEMITTSFHDVLSGAEEDNNNSEQNSCESVPIMTHNSQTPREVVELRSLSFASPNRVVNIGFWNIRTMFQSAKAAQIAREMRTYRLDVLGISECRWPGSDKIVLSTGETVIWSGKEDRHESGVALMMSKKAAKSLIEWKGVGDRILKAKFDSKYVVTTVVVCYAPTNSAEDSVKERFYDQLQTTVNEVSNHEMLIVGGDLNAKIGNDNTGRERCMGKYGLGTMNENGHLFADFCQENELVVGGTLFRHKDIHKYTWESPDGITRNQIDHIAISRKWTASLKDVRTKRGADVNSDHVLLLAKVKLSLRAKKMKVERRKLDVKRLRDEKVRDEFSLEIYNRFEVLMDEDVEDIDSYWMEYRDAVKETGEKVLGFEKRERKEWISEETWEAIEERKEVKKRLNRENDLRSDEREEWKQQYSEKEKEVKTRVRRDKRRYMDEKASEAEEAAKVNDSRTLFQISKELSKRGNFVSKGQVKKKDGTIATTEAEQQERWAEHFCEILNREEPQRTAVFEEGELLDIDCEAPTVGEIENAIKKMKNNKAAGSDGIPGELFKIQVEENARIMLKLFSKIWEDEKVPAEWLKGNIYKLPKKGDLGDCNNWRGITLLNIASKIFARCIFEKIQDPLEEVLRQNQAGFRKGRGCMDMVFVLRKLIEESVEFKKELYVNFVDFEKAFDSVFRQALWKVLREYGVPEKVIKMVRILYDGFECAVIHEGKLSAYFEVETGVKQGCLLSGLLFLLVIDWLMKRVTEMRSTGIEWVNDTVLEDLDYADDLGLVSNNFNDTQEKMTRLARRARMVGLRVSAKKTEILRLNTQEDRSVMLEGQALKDCEVFTYLGCKMSKTGGTEDDINNRIHKARGAFVSLKAVWSSGIYKVKTKLRLYSAIVKSNLLYGCECWTLTKKLENKLRVFHQKCLRRILRVFYPNLVSNRDILRRTEQKDIMEEVIDRKWRWTGHIARKPPEHLTRQALTWRQRGRRPRGRPRQTWGCTMDKEAMEIGGVKFANLLEDAQDRHRWRQRVIAARTLVVPGD